MIDICGMTTPGAVRENNDDRLLINQKISRSGNLALSVEDHCLAAVFDGVGGEAFGDEAAELAALFLSVMDPMEVSTESISGWLEKANQIILSRQALDRSHANMSTTTAGLVIQGDNFFAFNIGDSRIYRFRNPYLHRLSVDHSMSQDMQNLGLTADAAHSHVITRFLGGESAKPHLVDGTEQYLENDLFLLCTDGLWSFIEESELQSTLKEMDDLASCCANLVQKAIDNGSDDNISVLMIRRSVNG